MVFFLRRGTADDGCDTRWQLAPSNDEDGVAVVLEAAVAQCQAQELD